jgi:uncharacterized membrane protein SpoIIM required for sporulation
VDLDAYVAAHAERWEQLRTLTRRRRLDGPASDELVDAYQQVATNLSVVRSAAPDPSLIGYLSSVLSHARTRASGTRTMSWAAVVVFFAATFPAALYRTRRWWLTTMGVNLGVATVIAWWLLAHPRVLAAMTTPREVRRLVNQQFSGYYHQYAASHFAAHVWTNNAWVAALCIAVGVLGVPVVYLLWQNVANLAIVGALMIGHHRTGLFFGLILPHGMLELTAVFVAAGVGLRLFWSWVAPGGRPRALSLAAEGRTAAVLSLGLVAVLFVSGVIEAFVTPSGLPTWARIGVGALAEAGFLGYVFVVGRAAFLRGVTGDLTARDRADEVAVAG